MNFHVYILSSKNREGFHTGVTNNMAHCFMEQSAEQKRDARQLVYFETYDEMETARDREASLRHCQREDTVALVEEFNPNWDDLYPQITP